eukprot:CAMPEP_0198144212 /NCGR_PEP_ID=MMETSP1443-20131203/14191_1 /TAXON_ID=186043 /ORGANISM="Entomoneis sp., Strain CCMP2396" /LENGTH=168 /DNA_ID=CAMNT_0043807569 /DNA_START=91 /DNA_END=597 /DNA_ORIENTATION=-
MIVVNTACFQDDDDVSDGLNSDWDDDDVEMADCCRSDLKPASAPSRLQAVSVLNTATRTFYTGGGQDTFVPLQNNVTPDPSVCTNSPQRATSYHESADVAQQYQRSLRRLARSMQHSDISRSLIQQHKIQLLSEFSSDVPLTSYTELMAHRRGMYEWILQNVSSTVNM